MDIHSYTSRREAILTRLLLAAHFMHSDLKERPDDAQAVFFKEYHKICVELAELERDASGGSVTSPPTARPFRVSGAG